MCERSSSLAEDYKMVCDRVAHEDAMINVRTTWTLIFHGFLFAALTSGAGLYEKADFGSQKFDPVFIGLLLVCVLGAASAVAAFRGVRAAELQACRATNWWKNRAEQSERDGFPPLFIRSKGIGASAYFILLAIVWATLGVIVLLAGVW